jgi:hypothetical protein
MNTSAEQINRNLAGYTEVRQLDIQFEVETGSYELQLTLADAQGDTRILSCRDISSLKMDDFGGGLTQFLVLRCDDVREMQLDRVALHFAELERRSIVFDCLNAEVLFSS